MKKKGFTLVEMIAVLAITSLLIIMVGGIYVNGMKVTNKTKANTDIENQYRRAYDGLNRLLNDSNKIDIVEKPLNVRNSNKEFINSLFIYKKDNKTYIIGKVKEKEDTFSIYNIEVKKIYSNDEVIDISSIKEEEISNDIKSISFTKNKLASENFIDCEVEFKVLNFKKSYKFNIDISGGQEINLYLEDKNSGYSEWENSNMKFANFNVINKGNISIGFYGEIEDCTFNINGYGISDIKNNIKVNAYNITSINSDVFNPIPDFTGGDSNVDIEVEDLNDAISDMNNKTCYIVRHGEVGKFTMNKPKNISEVIGILKPLNNTRKVIIIDGNVNFIADNDIDSDDIFYLDNIAVISNGDIKFTNCPINSNSGIFELIANNNIIVNNRKAIVDIEGKSDKQLEEYFDKNLIKKEVDDFQKLKNGLEIG